MKRKPKKAKLLIFSPCPARNRTPEKTNLPAARRFERWLDKTFPSRDTGASALPPAPACHPGASAALISSPHPSRFHIFHLSARRRLGGLRALQARAAGRPAPHRRPAPPIVLARSGSSGVASVTAKERVYPARPQEGTLPCYAWLCLAMPAHCETKDSTSYPGSPDDRKPGGKIDVLYR